MSGKAVDEQTLGMCLPASTHCLNLTLHHSNIHQLPRFAELVAALVSYWVHTDEQEPPQIEHAAMHAHLELLSEAKKHRTWRIIFTGHSLGGMYAAVLLFKRSRRRWDRRMLDFAQKRAINYINANDPCSRAWGAINLRSFVDLAAQGVENGLVGGLRSIDGLVASQAVTAAARQLLSRPDFHFSEDFAKRYQHFAELRVLSPQSQFSHWRVFWHTPGSLRDHSMLAYMSRLFDAFGAGSPGSPECYVHSQTARVRRSSKVSVRAGGA
ncbi:unnamed protein product [Symbiodinium natans]|uniref:Uncharacterized protein n=1 Tax=Symbiodinium natans TaxID=878477 RepID=A0A812P8L3_9DINO|nr:unnamed protein product [Symbiodinium natans]